MAKFSNFRRRVKNYGRRAYSGVRYVRSAARRFYPKKKNNMYLIIGLVAIAGAAFYFKDQIIAALKKK